MPEFVNISAYKFVDLNNLADRKAKLLPLCQELELRGTILLSLEGINMFVAGTRENIDIFLETVRQEPEYQDLPIKESLSDHQPFSRMLVRLKKEIISMGVDAIRPKNKTSPKLTAKELKQWLDDGKDLTLYDVRNDYEVEVGTFTDAVPAGIDHFRAFPEATQRLPEDAKKKPLVMFCTGGIRCEKAGPLMEEQGFEQVYQLDGGILKYFEECGGDHYQGDCFVFDKRVAVDPNLQETEFEQCYACQAVLTAEQQQSELYLPPHSCPLCFRTDEQKMQDLMEERNNLFALHSTPLPGSVPYSNVRPMNVPLRFDHYKVIDFLVGMHAHLTTAYWQDECEANRIIYKGQPLAADDTIRAGWRVEHLVPQTTEPNVNAKVEFIYEDDALIVVNKPAPLPMHPSGRFNRNTLDFLIGKVFSGEQLRIVHRLDANTTGVVMFARKKSASRPVHEQFKAGTVDKVYLAKIHGHPSSDQFSCDAKLSDQPQTAGSRAVDASDAGREAATRFEVVARRDDGTSLVRCFPATGRTHQIRVHLSHLGHPIVGDPTYQADCESPTKQALDVNDPPMCLHAQSVTLDHPFTKERVTFTASEPTWAD
jgi:RluA family pseudouridine synthase